MILHEKALYNLIWIIIFLWVLKTSNILNRRIFFLQHVTGSCYNFCVMYEFIWLTSIECRLISSKVLLWHCISYFPYNICIVQICFDTSFCVYSRISNGKSKQNFSVHTIYGMWQLFFPYQWLSFQQIFFFCQVHARSIFVLLLLLSNCDLFTRSDSCFLSRRAEMQEGQMHWSSTRYQILSHTRFEKLIASNNLTQGSFYTSLSFYS